MNGQKTDRELMQQALDALEKHILEYETIEALRARLAQPEPEPVGEVDKDGMAVLWANKPMNNAKLYTAPPQREWQWLTDEEITALKRNGERYISSQDFARAIEAKLKEKNNG